MEHYKSRNNDFFHFTNPLDDGSELDDDDDYDYDELQYCDVDDDRRCDFNFHTYRPLGINQSPPANSQPIGVMNRNDTVTTSMEEPGIFNNCDLTFHLDNTMKNISDKLQHTIEDIGSRISHLDDKTCKLDKYVENMKNSEESYHGTTHRKLRQMQNILQEVQDGVRFLRDKHDIAETQLQLAKLQVLKRDKITAELTNRQSQTPHQYKSDPRFPHFAQLYQLNSFQVVVSTENDQFLSRLSQETTNGSSYSYSTSVQHLPSEPATLGSIQEHEFVQSSRNYESEFHAKYMPENSTFSNIRPHGEPPFSYEISNWKPTAFPLHFQEESSRRNYKHTPVAQTLPHALLTAIDLEDGSCSEENGNPIPVHDIVEKVTSMGFRRDLVRACMRKLTVNGSTVDLNSVLDRMMMDNMK